MAVISVMDAFFIVLSSSESVRMPVNLSENFADLKGTEDFFGPGSESE